MHDSVQTSQCSHSKWKITIKSKLAMVKTFTAIHYVYQMNGKSRQRGKKSQLMLQDTFTVYKEITMGPVNTC